ncbi:TPA_exp: Uncharacterized protein A8136_2794 [Trichophyton benhamiae CBS 112371]|uniref:Uncharacterized protein n=2 Tax=Trichophyton TaxID=5550 RepID=D4ALE2_ARTBC|nr:uncharacterized protein ARB_05139 [Trichophyton benhamiae CBS 112371]XP_003018133.1 uncharacterized protein TRV_07829 [Trichophyton verrucosum HKI 0517]EFE36201.1 hypothetical protein ARB_05139 [Trichophyton benhamiae CBS 112371]EFE37488.1 hypothetical protein TRV_07829 [Trichophyton verrucosum HKI 0517]DAA79009.1 TPA_exp: Uncharacterized protein A8136_2794 [Trichophyton benhamiae CBS 112371]
MAEPTSTCQSTSTTPSLTPETDTPNSSTSNLSDDGIRLSPNGIYLTLSEMGQHEKYHWALLIAHSPTAGTVLQQLRPNDEAEWEYSIQPAEVTTSRAMLVALKVGELPDVNAEWLAAVDECVRSSSIRDSEKFSCRAWVMGAIFALADGGFIDLEPCWVKVGMVEEEAKALVAGATSLDTSMVVSSKYL